MSHATANEMQEHGHENYGCCCLVDCNLGPCSTISLLAPTSGGEGE